MTTIAVRAGWMAADSRETDTHEALDHCFITTDKSVKIFRLPDGRVYGGADASEDIQRLYLSLLKKAPPPALGHITALLMHPSGKVEIYEGNIWARVHEPFYAIGTGAAFAVAAMKAGANARRAVKIATEMDPYSGGKILALQARK